MLINLPEGRFKMIVDCYEPNYESLAASYLIRLPSSLKW
jgi:hypothetical protein